MATKDLTYAEARELFTRQDEHGEPRRTEGAIENEMFYRGDHLQVSKDYRGFIGERPKPGGGNYGEFMAQVAAVFVSGNRTKELCERHDNGVLGRVPFWRTRPANTPKDKITDTQAKLMREADDALTAMWDDRDILGLFQDGVIKALLEGRCSVRPYILAKSRDANGNLIRQKSVNDALKLLRFEIVTCDKAGVFEDDETLDAFGVYAVEDTKTKSKRAEITYVDDQGITWLRVIDERDISGIKSAFRGSLGRYIAETETFAPREYPIGNLNGRLWLYEFKREALISPQIRQLQKCYNLVLTQMTRNVNVAGSRSTTYTNAMKPSIKTTVTDSEGKQEIVRHEVPVLKGVGTTLFLNGLPIYDEDGQITGYSSPGINTQEPVSPDTFIKSLQTYYEAILTEAYQLHVAISGDATASGKSRQEARAEFEKSLTITKTALDALGRWIIEVSLYFAADLCGRPEFLDLRCDFNTIVDAGTPDATERSQNIAEFEKGALSLETCLSRNGTEDTDVEIGKIEANPAYQIKDKQMRVDFINSALDLLTIEKQIEYLFPEMSETERVEYQIQLAKENPVLQSLIDARNNQTEEV